MKSNRILAATTATVFAISAHAESYSQFFYPTNIIGCGTIKSVRNLDQKPIYDYEYALRWGIAGSADSSGIIGQLVGGGVIGLAKGVAANIAISEATKDGMGREAAKDSDMDVREKRRGKYEVAAIAVEMDDGNILNLPLQKPPRWFAGSRQYVAGKRVRVFRLIRSTFESIQLQPADPPPAPGADGYDKACKATVVPQEKIDELETYGAHLVDESKVFE